MAEICNVIGIPDINKEMVTKMEVKNAIFENRYKEMVDIVKTKKKLEDIKEEDFREVQPYFMDKSVEKVRMAFKIRTQMVQDIPGNYKNKYRVRGTESDGLACTDCDEGVIMTQSHCLACPAWSGLREGLELSKIDDMVVFFRKLLVERSKV